MIKDSLKCSAKQSSKEKEKHIARKTEDQIAAHVEKRRWFRDAIGTDVNILTF